MRGRIQHLLCSGQHLLLGITSRSGYRFAMNLGGRLKQARENRRLTQEQLAELVPGASQAMISALETRDSETTTLLFAFADALRISPRWLQDGTGDSGMNDISDRSPRPTSPPPLNR